VDTPSRSGSKKLSIKYSLFLVVFLTWIPSASTSANGATKPNIIVFYTDDHGYADLACQGVVKDLKTPNIDALARSGVLAKHGYSMAPQCVPSRGGLITGKYQGRFGLEGNWKLLRGGEREYLFDLWTDLEEKTNVASKCPEIADRLRAKLEAWSNEMKPPGLSRFPLSLAGKNYFNHYLVGKKINVVSGEGSDEPTLEKRRKKR